TQPVATCIVNEGDAEAASLACIIWLIALTEPCPHAPDGQPGARETLRIGHDYRRQIFAAKEGIGVRPCAGIQDWMLFESLKAWVVPAASEVVAFTVVRGACQPARMHCALLIFGGIDSDHLPVRLMVVDPVK